MNKLLEQEHQNCELSIRWKLFKNKIYPTPGLFCKCHDTFLDWLPQDIAFDLIDNHKMEEERWVDRKKKTKPKKI